MTFRTRVAPKPTRRRARRSDTRRAVYITLAFTLAIASAVSLMGGVFLASYYSEHGTPVAAVDGVVISKDGVRDRGSVDLARLQRQIANYQTLRNQGKISTDEYGTLTTAIQNNEAQATLYQNALTELITEAELQQYATKNNINVTDQQVDAQIQADATIAEMRHIKIMSVAPRVRFPASSPGSKDIADADTKAQALLAELKSGKKWDDVAKEASAYSTTSSQSTGDLGLITRDVANDQLDPNIADAVFALKKANDVTTILKSTNGAFNIATVTTIAPEFVDTDWQSTVASTSSGDGYRAFARAEAIQKAIKKAVEAKYISGPTVQRQVDEITINAGIGQAGDGDEVKLHIMVFSPNGSESSASTVSTDPKTASDADKKAWATAKDNADKAVAALKKDPTQFTTMAVDTNVNNDKYFDTVAGDVPWIPADLFNAQTTTGNQGLGMVSVQAAVFNPNLAPGTIMDPILEPALGYVVVDFEGRRPAPDQRIANAQFAVNTGTDFVQEAKTSSEVSDALTGGDLGWISPYQYNTPRQSTIFKTPVGSVSPMVSDNGYHIYKVIAEQTRTPDATAQAKLKPLVFPHWLAELQSNSLVWQDQAALQALTPQAAAT
jgi:parvulin-like peptidyl-prolyl isomerase